ncbi:MAG: phosphoenolpyruvate--protein phosphotransferase [Phycisphaerales bacterium]|nr:phosphoenolpyruvate--protein phosphotransferase [Phycisphaerales bacterium]
MKKLRGIPVAPGVVIGTAIVLDDTRLRIPRRVLPPAAASRERQRLTDAMEASLADLEHLRQTAESQLGVEAAKVFAFHQGLLRDKSLTGPMLKRIEAEQVQAEFAVQEQFRALADLFARMPDPAFRTKVDDVWDLERRVLRHLIGEHQAECNVRDGTVVLASELTPTQTASFDRTKVLGFGTTTGGPTSHAGILARALGKPAVFGIENLTEEADDGDTVILDGDRGLVILEPDDETLLAYQGFMQRAQSVRLELAEIASLEPVTTDGCRIELMANIEFSYEIPAVIENGGDGVGLFRTEFLWLTSDHEPTEEEQLAEYSAAVSNCAGRPLTIRTFDLGADKQTQERQDSGERNPFLGCRSIRYCLQNIPMFKTQLRAILRASALGPIRVMFPLVSNTMELRQAKMLIHDVMEDLTEAGMPFDAKVPLGMMVEVPSAALMAATFAREVDFFSIGTNDLVQYTLAVDRTNEKVAGLYSAGNPAVLKLIKDVVRAGRRQGISVSCCGETAGDAEYTMLLIGLGLRNLSVTPSRIPYLKRVVRSVSVPQCERLARTVGSFDSERQVTAFLRDQARRLFPELFDGRAVDERS